MYWQTGFDHALPCKIKPSLNYSNLVYVSETDLQRIHMCYQFHPIPVWICKYIFIYEYANTYSYIWMSPQKLYQGAYAIRTEELTTLFLYSLEA